MEVLTVQGTVKSEIALPEALFGQTVAVPVLWESVRSRLANQRQGTACTKTRAEVSGTGKKPWRQKHTGRARHGSRRSPIWRGGGIVFGPKPRDYSYELPKKERALALVSALSAKHSDKAIKVVENFALSSTKTRELVDILGRLNLSGSVLLVVDKASRELLLASRNISWLKVIRADQLGAYDVLECDTLLFTEAGLAELTQRPGIAGKAAAS